jgi:hypothetical protein
MKVTLTEYDIKTLTKEKNGYTYRIKTAKGDIVGSELPSVEALIEHAEEQLKRINLQMLKK